MRRWKQLLYQEVAHDAAHEVASDANESAKLRARELTHQDQWRPH
jgi:hypothetical protein